MSNLPYALAIVALGLAIAGFQSLLLPPLLKISFKRHLVFMDYFFYVCLNAFMSDALESLNLGYEASHDYFDLFTIVLLFYVVVFRIPKWEIHVEKEGLS